MRRGYVARGEKKRRWGEGRIGKLQLVPCWRARRRLQHLERHLLRILKEVWTEVRALGKKKPTWPSTPWGVRRAVPNFNANGGDGRWRRQWHPPESTGSPNTSRSDRTGMLQEMILDLGKTYDEDIVLVETMSDLLTEHEWIHFYEGNSSCCFWVCGLERLSPSCFFLVFWKFGEILVGCTVWGEWKSICQNSLFVYQCSSE